MFLLDFSSFAQHLDVGHVYVICTSALHFQPVHDPTARRSMARTNNSLLPLFHHLSGWPWSSFLLQPLIPPLLFFPCRFHPCFSTDPPLTLNHPLTSFSDLFIACKVIPHSSTRTPLSLISSDSFHPSEPLLTPTSPTSPYPPFPSPLLPSALSDLCQSSPGALRAQTAGVTPLKDDGGSRS